MCAPSVVAHDPAEASMLFSFEALERGYRQCRRRKRGTANALRFERDLEENLLSLREELVSGRYQPLRSVCFITSRPKLREIVAADFRDRVVHHLLVGRLEPLWERAFIHDSYACRKGKGTHAAVDRLSSFIRKATCNHTVHAHYAHLDVRSFFPSIDHDRLLAVLRRRSQSPTLSWLCERIVRRDIKRDAVLKGPPEAFDRIPPGKSLLRAPPSKGLPIGNLTSQFFANVYLNELDQFVKRTLRVRFYLRYMDDLLLLAPGREELLAWRDRIGEYVREHLFLEMNAGAERIAPVSSGIDFLGYVVHPHHRLVRRRVVRSLTARLSGMEGAFSRTSGGFRWALYREGQSEYLRSMTASYRAHFANAHTARLRSSIRARFPWLRDALSGPQGEPFWGPRRLFPSFAGQVHWFLERFRGCLVVFRVGKYLELFGASAERIAKLGGAKLLRARRGRPRPWVRFPRERSGALLAAARRGSIRKIVFVDEVEDAAGPVKARRATAIGTCLETTFCGVRR